MNINYFILIILFNLIISIDFLLAIDGSRTSNGLLYPRKRFIPSENRFYVGLYKSRDRLRCIKLCQELSICQTVMYERRKQECILFSEHLVTIRLDKDSLKELHHRITVTKNKIKQSSILFSYYRKNNYRSCHNCDL